MDSPRVRGLAKEKGKSMELNWYFRRGGVQTKTPSMGRGGWGGGMDIFCNHTI